MTRIVAAAAGICAAVSLAAQDRPPQIRSGVELVAVDVQVVDRGGNPVPNLTRDDFAAASNITVYALHMDSSFLDAFSAFTRGGVSQTLFRDSGMFATGLEMVAGAAGGDVLRVQAGTADSAFDRVLRETSAHYLLGVEVAESDRDGEAHTIRVQVRRRGLTVRGRASVIVPKPAPGAAGVPETPPASPLSGPSAPPPEVAAAEPEPPRAPVGELEEVLASAARYLEGYERDIPAVVSEEHYNQRGSTGIGEPMAARRLRSDMLIIAEADLGWIGFRDVFEVDGQAIRGRDERLVDLFLKPHADRMAQARRIVAESSRFNLNTGPYVVQRTINMPMTALRFLRRPNQPRSRYKFEGRKTEGGIEVALVSFEEKAKPRLIASEDEAAARGRFWVDPITGRVVRSELSFDTSVDFGTRSGKIELRSKVSVRYAEEPRFRLWLPVSMDEQYVVGHVLLEGQATYANFRRFAVDTSTSVKTP